jgi:hypothetical protein
MVVCQGIKSKRLAFDFIPEVNPLDILNFS